MHEEHTGGVGGPVRPRARARISAPLTDTEIALLGSSAAALDAFRPRVADVASFDLLVTAVEESAALDESIVQLRRRLAGLGTTVTAVAKEVAGFL